MGTNNYRSGSWRPKHLGILRIRIQNTVKTSKHESYIVPQCSWYLEQISNRTDDKTNVTCIDSLASLPARFPSAEIRTLEGGITGVRDRFTGV